MRISAKLRVFGNPLELEELFKSESRDSKSDRASYKTSVKSDCFFITLHASDSTAFRAMLNSVFKLLAIYEKTNAVVEDESR